MSCFNYVSVLVSYQSCYIIVITAMHINIKIILEGGQKCD